MFSQPHLLRVPLQGVLSECFSPKCFHNSLLWGSSLMGSPFKCSSPNCFPNPISLEFISKRIAKIIITQREPNYSIPLCVKAIVVYNVAAYSFAGAHFPSAIADWRWSEWCGLAVAIGPLLPIPIYALATVVSSCRNLPRLTKFRVRDFLFLILKIFALKK